MVLGHILSGGQFTREQVEAIFETADWMSKEFGKRIPITDPKGIAVLFDEPSTGTRNCIDAAADLLGVPVITASYSAETDLSIKKGETFAHTVRRICAQSPNVGVIFIRCHEAESLNQAVIEADKYGVKIVNCGNGGTEHPTQALSDLRAILRYFDPSKRLTVVYTPTVKGSRVFHSHMALFPVIFPCLEVIVAAPDDHQIPKAEAEKLRLRVANVDTNPQSLMEAVRGTGEAQIVVYVNRTQLERYSQIDRNPQPGLYDLIEQLRTLCDPYLVTKDVLDAMPEGSICMHALPIGSYLQEIPPDCEDHPKVICFTEQLRSKTLVMMSLLSHLLAP